MSNGYAISDKLINFLMHVRDWNVRFSVFLHESFMDSTVSRPFFSYELTKDCPFVLWLDLPYRGMLTSACFFLILILKYAHILTWTALCDSSASSFQTSSFHYLSHHTAIIKQPASSGSSGSAGHWHGFLNILSPLQIGQHFTDGMLKAVFLHEGHDVSIEMSLEFFSQGCI